MRTMITSIVVAMLAAVPFANATPINERDLNLSCRFGVGEQQSGLTCRARMELCEEAGNSGQCKGVDVREPRTGLIGRHLELECSNQFELESHEFGVQLIDDTLWVNADRHGKLATIRIRDFELNNVPAAMNHNERYRADLLLTNSITAHLEGFCRLERENDN